MAFWSRYHGNILLISASLIHNHNKFNDVDIASKFEQYFSNKIKYKNRFRKHNDTDEDAHPSTTSRLDKNIEPHTSFANVGTVLRCLNKNLQAISRIFNINILILILLDIYFNPHWSFSRMNWKVVIVYKYFNTLQMITC